MIEIIFVSIGGFLERLAALRLAETKIKQAFPQLP